MAPPSPVVAALALSLRLNNRREQCEMSVQEIADQLGVTRNYWSAISSQRKVVSEVALRRVFDILDFESGDRDELLALRETATRESGWWVEHSALLNPEVQRLYALEHGASQVLNYESLLIPGLLQSPDYARAVIRADATIRQVEIEQRVEIRMRRQERLFGDDPLKLDVVLSEAALRQQIGGADVLKGQLDHLIALIEQSSDNIDIGVIPFAATGCNLFGAGTVMLLDFDSPHLPTLAWSEALTNWGVITAAEPVRDLAIAFANAKEVVLDRRRTLQVVNNCRKEL